MQQGPKIPLPRPGKLAITATQVALVELVLLTGAAMRFPKLQPLPVLIVWVVFALLALIAAVRRHGLCGYQWVGVLLRHRSFTRTMPKPADSDPVPPVLRRVLPDLVLSWQADRGGNKVGLAGFDGGWTAVIRVAPGSRIDRAPLIQELRTAFLESDTWLSGAQLLTFAMPAMSDSERPVFMHWLAVRYQTADLPAPAEARGGGEAGALRATASAARRLCTRLIDAGYLCTALSVAELAPELVLALTGTKNPAGFSMKTSWSSVLCGPLTHTTYLPARRLTSAPLGALARGSVLTACSYTLYRKPGATPRIDVSVRVARTANSGRTPPPAHRLVPAHGRHEPLVRATLPLALPTDPSANRAAYRLIQPEDHRADR